MNKKKKTNKTRGKIQGREARESNTSWKQGKGKDKEAKKRTRQEKNIENRKEARKQGR